MKLLWGSILLAMVVAADEGHTQQKLYGAELIIQEFMPTPMRCEAHFGGAAFSCRYQTASPHGLALELSFDSLGPSASLTYGFENPKSLELLDLLKRFFLRFGLKEKAFEECALRALWESSEVLFGGGRVACRHAEFGGRATYEIISVTAAQ